MFTKVKFKQETHKEFLDELNEKVEKYFFDNKISKLANTDMVVKTCAIIISFISLYLIIITNQLNSITGLLFCVLLGLIHPLFFINIAHDASHNTYSKNKNVNRAILYLLNIVGINSYIFEFLHNRVHHAFTSIEGHDVIVEEYSLLRLSQNQPYKKYHKYQKYYAPFIYLFFGLIVSFSIDFILFKRGRMGNSSSIKHPKSEWIKLYLFKGLYIVFSLVIPLILVNKPWFIILCGFFIIHFISGAILTLVGVLNHQIEESIFPIPNEDGLIPKSKKVHELEVTYDFAPFNKLALFYFGGFNTHVAHHLYPNICHVHYIPITKIISETVSKYGLEYNKKSLIGAIKSHFRYLDRLAQRPSQTNYHRTNQ